MCTQTQDLQKYLVATQLCDCDDPWLRRRVAEVIQDANTPEEKALKIFYFVRDEIRFSLAFSRSSASQILKRGYGECGSKTNLHVAFLRAAEIPARLRWVKARAEVLHGLIMEWLYRQMPPTPSHFWPECYLGGKWVSCEAMLDKPLYEGMLKQGLITKDQVPTIEWDGKSDLILLEPWIVEKRGFLSSVDDALEELRHSDEGLPPVWIERIIAPVFYPLNLRCSDRIRQVAR